MLLSVLKGRNWEAKLVTSRYVKNPSRIYNKLVRMACFMERGSWTGCSQNVRENSCIPWNALPLWCQSVPPWKIKVCSLSVSPTKPSVSSALSSRPKTTGVQVSFADRENKWTKQGIDAGGGPWGRKRPQCCDRGSPGSRAIRRACATPSVPTPRANVSFLTRRGKAIPKLWIF